jgi:hypothetical protein
MSKSVEKELVEDFLEEDAEIPGQKVVLVSFLSPETVLEDKNKYFFRAFLKGYELKWKTTRLEAWLAEQASAINGKIDSAANVLRNASGGDVTAESKEELKKKEEELLGSKVSVQSLVEEFQAFCRKEQKDITVGTLAEEYDDFMFAAQTKLEEEFHAKNDFRTTIRGVKVRGVYSSEVEAAARAKRLQKLDPHFNIYAGAVGKWLAWDPNPNKIADQEYAEDQLNMLMKKYKENEESRDQFYTEQKALKTQKKSGAVSQPAEISEPNISVLPASAMAAAAGGGAHDSLFSGPADLAIQRKMEQKGVEDGVAGGGMD